MQARVQQLEADEQAHWLAEREQKLSYQQTQIMKKHAMELNAFHKKVQSRVEALKKQRAVELEQLLQKYQNMKKDLDSQQALELQKLQKKTSTSHSTSPFTSKFSPTKPLTKKPANPYSTLASF